jgi:hypothetical protein
MDFLELMGIVFLLHGFPTMVAASLPIVLAFHFFGREKWVARRVLAAWLAGGVAGYAVLFVYYSLYGIPPLASSIYNHSLHGAFFGAGYGGLAGYFYFRFAARRLAESSRPA